MTYHKHAGEVMAIIEKALKDLDGIHIQSMHTRTESSTYGQVYTHLNIEILIDHLNFKQTFEELKEMSAESFRQEFLKILKDELDTDQDVL